MEVRGPQINFCLGPRKGLGPDNRGPSYYFGPAPQTSDCEAEQGFSL